MTKNIVFFFFCNNVHWSVTHNKTRNVYLESK